MTSKKTTKLRRANSGSGGIIYIPQGVLNDPSFPFSDGDEMKIEIQENHLVFSPPEPEEVTFSEAVNEMTDLFSGKKHNERWYNP